MDQTKMRKMFDDKLTKQKLITKIQEYGSKMWDSGQLSGEHCDRSSGHKYESAIEILDDIKSMIEGDE